MTCAIIPAAAARRLLVTVALGAALAAAPAGAQGQDWYGNFGRNPGQGQERHGDDADDRSGWSRSRSPGAWSDGRAWPDDRERDRFVRDQYERGYRMGRDDERRAREQMAQRDHGDAMRELDQARRQILDGELRQAWISLGRAETRLLTRVTRAPREQAAFGGAIGVIRDARHALEDRRPAYARDRIARAQTLIGRGAVMARGGDERWGGGNAARDRFGLSDSDTGWGGNSLADQRRD